MHWIDDDARQPGAVEQAFFEIEFPRAVLLRLEQPLQAIGEPRHDALGLLQLLVEKTAQAAEFLGIAEFARGDDWVGQGGEINKFVGGKMFLVYCLINIFTIGFGCAMLGHVETSR